MRSHVGQLDALQAISVVAAAMPSTSNELDFLQVTCPPFPFLHRSSSSLEGARTQTSITSCGMCYVAAAMNHTWQRSPHATQGWNATVILALPLLLPLYPATAHAYEQSRGAQAMNCEFGEDPEATFEATIQRFQQLVRSDSEPEWTRLACHSKHAEPHATPKKSDMRC